MKMISNYTRNKALQKEMHKWVSNYCNWNYFVTFNFNNPHTNLITGRTKLRNFSTKIDCAICGKNFKDLCPNTERNFFIAFPEHLKSNFHYHALLRTPDPERFEEIANDIWKGIVDSGDLHIKNEGHYLGKGDAFDIGSYITKESYHTIQYESFIISSEFSN